MQALDSCAVGQVLNDPEYDSSIVPGAGDRETIRVCEVTDFGGPEVLRAGERPWPQPAPNELVVSIAATNVNPSDIAARSGAHRFRLAHLRPPFVPGWDFGGVVSDVGAGVSGYAVGDRVVGMIPWIQIAGRVRGYAQAAAVDPGWVAPCPAEPRWPSLQSQRPTGACEAGWPRRSTSPTAPRPISWSNKAACGARSF